MIGWLLYLLLFLAVSVLIYSGWKYITGGRRKLEEARRKEQFYLLDDPHTTNENFMITYKGVQFEGEKKIGATEEAFTVTSIVMRILEPNDLYGLTRDDFYEIERNVYASYPDADIHWQHPIDQFLKHQP